MKKLFILGAGGFGREVYQWVHDIQHNHQRWESVHFLDDSYNGNPLENFSLADKLVGNIKYHEPQNNEEFICAIGDPIGKLEVCKMLLEKEAQFINIIHPSAIVGETCQIGKGVIVCPGSIITSNARIGDFVTVNCLSTVGHDAIIDEGSTLSGHCDVMGGAYLGKCVFLGSGARILPKVKVNNNARVGAGSVVINKVLENTTVFGNPAKIIY